MNRPRTLQQMLRPLLLISTLLLSFYLSVVIQNAFDRKPLQNDQLPDAFMEAVHAVRMDQFGQLESELDAPKLTHYPNDDRTLIQHPHLTIHHQPHSPPWQVTAEQAETRHGLEIVYLWDHVKIHQAVSANNYETTLLTSALTVYPEKRYAETDRPVTMMQPGGHVQAVGMQVNMPEGWIKFLSKAHGFYDPDRQTPLNQPAAKT